MKKFEPIISCHNQFGIEFIIKTDEDKKVAEIVKETVINNFVRSEDYIYSNNAGAFLQSYQLPIGSLPGYLLVEFWYDKGADVFINYLNQKIERRLNLVKTS